MTGRLVQAMRAGWLVLALAIFVTMPGVVHAQMSASALAAYNAWIAQAIPAIDTNNVQAEIIRLSNLRQAAREAEWLNAFPAERALLDSKLTGVIYWVNNSDPRQPVEFPKAKQELANLLDSIHTKMVQANGGQEVLNTQNLAAVAPATTGTGTGTGTGTNTAPGTGTVTNPQPVTPGPITPGGNGPGSLLGVNMDPGGMGGTTAPYGTGTANTTATATAPATTNATSTTNGATATTGGAVNRGAAKQSLTQADALLRSQLSDENLNNGAILGIDQSGGVSALQAARDSLSDIASLINRPPLSTNYAADVTGIVGPMQSIATANFGGQGNTTAAFQQGNARIRQVREEILGKLAALSAKIDAGQ